MWNVECWSTMQHCCHIMFIFLKASGHFIGFGCLGLEGVDTTHCVLVAHLHNSILEAWKCKNFKNWVSKCRFRNDKMNIRNEKGPKKIFHLCFMCYTQSVMPYLSTLELRITPNPFITPITPNLFIQSSFIMHTQQWIETVSNMVIKTGS